jgi:hypothetical protein
VFEVSWKHFLFVDVLMSIVGGLVPSVFVLVYNGKLQLMREMAVTMFSTFHTSLHSST